jgi:hypothetical protein
MNNIVLQHNMDVFKVEPGSDTKIHNFFNVKEEEALGYSSLKSEGKQIMFCFVGHNFNCLYVTSPPFKIICEFHCRELCRVCYL